MGIGGPFLRSCRGRNSKLRHSSLPKNAPPLSPAPGDRCPPLPPPRYATGPPRCMLHVPCSIFHGIFNVTSMNMSTFDNQDTFHISRHRWFRQSSMLAENTLSNHLPAVLCVIVVRSLLVYHRRTGTNKTVCIELPVNVLILCKLHNRWSILAGECCSHAWQLITCTTESFAGSFGHGCCHR